MKVYYVYILASSSGTLYTGVTNNLKRRVYEHKQGIGSEFTAKYGVDKLLYYEIFRATNAAIGREKQIKGWKRDKKIDLIDAKNSEWQDLSEGWYY